MRGGLRYEDVRTLPLRYQEQVAVQILEKIEKPLLPEAEDNHPLRHLSQMVGMQRG